MTPQDKKLLIQEICERLPYGVYAEHMPTQIRGKLHDIKILHLYKNTNAVQDIRAYVRFLTEDYINVTYFKPLLRPMSSMTAEEIHEFQEKLGKDCEIYDSIVSIIDSSRKHFSLLELKALFNWLNSHHFDYNDLIEKGLALEAPENLYNIK